MERIGKLEMARELLDDVLEKRYHHRKRVKNKVGIDVYGCDPDYHPYQLEQQLIFIRRLLLEGKSELGSNRY